VRLFITFAILLSALTACEGTQVSSPLSLSFLRREVTDTTVTLSNGEVVRYGFCLWAAGNGPVPLVSSQRIVKIIDSGFSFYECLMEFLWRTLVACYSWCWLQVSFFGTHGCLFNFSSEHNHMIPLKPCACCFRCWTSWRRWVGHVRCPPPSQEATFIALFGHRWPTLLTPWTDR